MDASMWELLPRQAGWQPVQVENSQFFTTADIPAAEHVDQLSLALIGGYVYFHDVPASYPCRLLFRIPTMVCWRCELSPSCAGYAQTRFQPAPDGAGARNTPPYLWEETVVMFPHSHSPATPGQVQVINITMRRQSIVREQAVPWIFRPDFSCDVSQTHTGNEADTKSRKRRNNKKTRATADTQSLPPATSSDQSHNITLNNIEDKIKETPAQTIEKGVSSHKTTPGKNVSTNGSAEDGASKRDGIASEIIQLEVDGGCAAVDAVTVTQMSRNKVPKHVEPQRQYDGTASRRQKSPKRLNHMNRVTGDRSFVPAVTLKSPNSKKWFENFEHRWADSVEGPYKCQSEQKGAGTIALNKVNGDGFEGFTKVEDCMTFQHELLDAYGGQSGHWQHKTTDWTEFIPEHWRMAFECAASSVTSSSLLACSPHPDPDMADEDSTQHSQSSRSSTPNVSNPGTPRQELAQEVRATPPLAVPSTSSSVQRTVPAQPPTLPMPPSAAVAAAATAAATAAAMATPPQQVHPMAPQSKYSSLLAVIEDMGRDIRPTYAGNRTSSERLKRSIVHARILVRECLMECERSART